MNWECGPREMGKGCCCEGEFHGQTELPQELEGGDSPLSTQSPMPLQECCENAEQEC